MVKVYVDSRAAKSGTSTDFEFQLPVPITLDTPHIASVDVVCFPNAFRNVDEKCCRLYLYQDDVQLPSYSSSESWTVVELTQGHYSVVSLATEVQRALNSVRTLPDAFTVT